MRDTRPTPRQLQMLSLAAAGLSRDEIANRLYVAERTVQRTLDDLRERIGVGGKPARNVTHALTLCIAAGYIRIDSPAEVVFVVEITQSGPEPEPQPDLVAA